MVPSNPNPERVRAFLVNFGKNLLCLLLLTAAVSLLLHRLFLPGFPVYRDNPAHLTKAYAYVENLRQGGSVLDGWSMDNCGGYPLLLYYPKTGFWLIAACHSVLSLSVVLAYKLVMVLSILLPLIGLFFLLKKDSNRLAALFCAILFLIHNNLIHYALSGMWSNTLATGVLFLFGTSLFAFADNPTHKKAIAAGLLLGLLTLTHLYIMLGGLILWATVFIALLVFSDRHRRLRSAFLLLVPAIGFLTSYLYTYQFVKTSGWLVPAKGELPLVSAGTILGNLLWKGDFFSHGPGAAGAANVLGNVAIAVGILFAILGVAYTFDSRKKGKGFHVRAISMLLFVGLSSAMASGIIVPGVGLKGEWLRNFGFLRSTKIHGYRFMILARAGILYFSAYGLSRLMKDRALPAIAGLGKVSLARKFPWPALVPLCGSLFLTVNLPFFFYHRSLEEISRNPFFPARDSALLKTSSALPTARDLTNVCRWLRQNGGGGENRRVFVQNTLGNALLKWRDALPTGGDASPFRVVTTEDTITHFTHLPAISPVLSGMPQIGSWIGGNLYPIEKISLSESGMFLGSHVESLDDADLVLKKRYLQRLNIGYVVTCEPRLRFRLMSSRYFEHKETFGAFDIFQLPDLLYIVHKPGWAYFSLPDRYIRDNKLEITRFHNRAIDISFENYATMIDLHVAVCHHPFWKASVDGKPLRIESDDIGLMKIPLEMKDEKGKLRTLLEKHTLRLRYVPDRGASVAISLVSLVLCIALLLLPGHENTRTQPEQEAVVPAPPLEENPDTGAP